MPSSTKLAPVGLAAVVGLVLAGIGWSFARAFHGHAGRADFAFNNAAEVSTLDPAGANGVPEGRVIRALFEGLFVRNPGSGLPEPAAAEAYNVSPDGKTWNFAIRKNLRWSNGDPLNAHDFEWNFQRVLSAETASSFAPELWCIRGAKAFTTGVDASGAKLQRDWTQVGVKAPADDTLVLELEHPVSYLLDLLACYQLCPIDLRALREAMKRWPKTWQSEWTKPEHLVVNGPFKLLSHRLNDRLRLVKNGDYWDADRVAFSTIDVFAIEDATTAFNLYLAGDLDWLDGNVPSSLVKKLVPRDDFSPRPYLATYFYRVNVTKPPLDDKRVRQALYLSINRIVICDKLLRGGQKPNYSLVPWGRIGPYVAPQQRHEDPRRAKGLLAEAGFGPDAKKFPALEILYNTSEIHRDVAELVADSWAQVLGVEARLKNQEWKSYIDAQSNLRYDLSRSSWISDYSDPLSFFAVFESNSENNRTGWKNARYDSLVESARVEGDIGTRNALFQQAENILMDELPILPIYSYVSENLINPRLGGFASNELNEQLPKYWYWMSDDELKNVRASLPASEKRTLAHGPKNGLYSPAMQSQRMARSNRRK